MIVTRVFPSFVPEEGSTAVIVGVLAPAVPNAKQFGSERVVVPNVSVMLTGTEEEVASGNAGVTSVTEVAVTAVTRASRVTPAAVKVARVVDGVPEKRPPLIVRVVPPVAGPKLGLQNVTKGPVFGAAWKAIVIVAVAEFEPTVALARTVASPTPEEHRAVVAAPDDVTTEISERPFCWKEEVDRSVEKETPVPSGTLAPFNVTRA
jgi:hypothetical protein